MAVFHGYTTMEEDTLRCPPFFGVMKKDMFSGVYKNTDVYYGYSFYLGWSSFAMSILATAFVLAAACRRCDAQAVIDQAMARLKKIAYEEKADKKLEEKEEKRRRQELEKQIKKEKKAQKPAVKFGMFKKIKIKGKKRVKMNASDSEIDYEIKNTKRDKEEKLRKLKEEAELEIAKEKDKLKIKKDNDMKELAKAQRDLEDVERRIRELEKGRKEKDKKRKMEEDSSADSQSDSDSDVEKKKRKSTGRRRRSVDNTKPVDNGMWFTIDSKCGKVVNPNSFDSGHYSCCDPYTLHLPSGLNPPPYRP